MLHVASSWQHFGNHAMLASFAKGGYRHALDRCLPNPFNKSNETSDQHEWTWGWRQKDEHEDMRRLRMIMVPLARMVPVAADMSWLFQLPTSHFGCSLLPAACCTRSWKNSERTDGAKVVKQSPWPCSPGNWSFLELKKPHQLTTANVNPRGSASPHRIFCSVFPVVGPTEIRWWSPTTEPPCSHRSAIGKIPGKDPPLAWPDLGIQSVERNPVLMMFHDW